MGRFMQGSKVQIAGRLYTFHRELESEIWQLEDEVTGRFDTYTRSQLNQLLKIGALIFAKANRGSPQRIHIGLSEQQMDIAKIRRSYVKAVEGIPSSSKLMVVAIRQVWEKLGQPNNPPHAGTVQRWRKKYETAGEDSMALLSQTWKRGNRAPRYPREVEELVQLAIEDVYMTRERRSIQDVLERAQGLIQRENRQRPEKDQLEIPSRGMVHRRIKRIPAYDRALARFGFHAARNMFRSSKGPVFSGVPLERAEIDHTPIDLMVVDDETALPLGRPWLTVCVDHFTRCILGFYIGFNPPSYLSVAQCLKHAFLPKDDLKTLEPTVKNEWPAHGVMSQLVADRGKEFLSESFDEACFTLNVEIVNAPSKTGWFKPVIERLLGRINKEAAQAHPGTTFSNILEKDDYNPSKHAIVRYSTLKTILVRWIVDVYHQQTHSALGCSPAAHWAANTCIEDIRLPDDVSLLDAMLGSCDSRTLTHQGIQYDCLFYNSIELANIRKRFGEKLEVNIRVDESDIGHIYVLAPDTRLPIKVPALEFQYAAGISSWQHKVFRSFAKRHRKSDTEWLEAKLEIAELVQAELMFKKQATRKNLARFKYSTTSRASSLANPTPPSVLPAPQITSSFPDESEVRSSTLMDFVPVPLNAQYRQRESKQ